MNEWTRRYGTQGVPTRQGLRVSCRQDNVLVRSGLDWMPPPLPPLGAISRLGFRLEATLVPDNRFSVWLGPPDPIELPYSAEVVGETPPKEQK